MARVLSWEELRPGLEAWCEWMFGTVPIRGVILQVNTDFGLFKHEKDRIHFTRKDQDFRFWDSCPTEAERQNARWPIRMDVFWE